MRLCFPNQGSYQPAFRYRQLFAQSHSAIGTALLIVRSPAVVDHIMQPSSQLDSIQVSGIRAEAFHGLQHILDMIERMVEAAWPGVMLPNFLEGPVGQGWVHGPAREKVMPLSLQHVIHEALSSEPLCRPRVYARCPRPFILLWKGGASWIRKTSTTCHFFREDKQAPKRLPVRDTGEAWPAHRPRQQRTVREAGPQRPLPMRVGQTLPSLLPQVRLLLP